MTVVFNGRAPRGGQAKEGGRTTRTFQEGGTGWGMLLEECEQGSTGVEEKGVGDGEWQMRTICAGGGGREVKVKRARMKAEVANRWDSKGERATGERRGFTISVGASQARARPPLPSAHRTPRPAHPRPPPTTTPTTFARVSASRCASSLVPGHHRSAAPAGETTSSRTHTVCGTGTGGGGLPLVT